VTSAHSNAHSNSWHMTSKRPRQSVTTTGHTEHIEPHRTQDKPWHGMAWAGALSTAQPCSAAYGQPIGHLTGSYDAGECFRLSNQVLCVILSPRLSGGADNFPGPLSSQGNVSERPGDPELWGPGSPLHIVIPDLPCSPATVHKGPAIKGRNKVGRKERKTASYVAR
jgi:hypothetical protein